MQRSDAVRRGAVFEMRGSSVPNLTQPPKVLRSFQNKSQIVTAPPVVIMIYGSAYHQISRAQIEAKHAKLRSMSLVPDDLRAKRPGDPMKSAQRRCSLLDMQAVLRLAWCNAGA